MVGLFYDPLFDYKHTIVIMQGVSTGGEITDLKFSLLFGMLGINRVYKVLAVLYKAAFIFITTTPFRII